MFSNSRLVAKVSKEHAAFEICDKWSKVGFKVVLEPIISDLSISKAISEATASRRIMIEKLIESRMETLNEEKKKQITEKKDVVVAIYPGWITNFFKALEIVEVTDRSELKGSYLYPYFKHNIIITVHETTTLQAEIDFTGLCWIAWYETKICPGQSLEIIVGINGFIKFFCMMVAFEFYDCFCGFPELVEIYTKPGKQFDIYDLKIMTTDYGLFGFPSQKTLEAFPKRFVEYYPSWKRVPYYDLKVECKTEARKVNN
jgi:hypothetical protein